MTLGPFHISTMNLILWGCVIWLPAFMAVILRNETKFKKNLSMGVTLPQEAREDSEVLAILDSFKKQLTLATVLVTLIALPCMLIPKAGTTMTVWMIWLLFAMVIPYVPYVTHHKKLKQLKEERGWKQATSTTRVVELSGAVYNIKWMSPVIFFVPLAL